MNDKGGKGRVKEKVRKVEKTGNERLERKAGKGQYDEGRSMRGQWHGKGAEGERR